MTTAQAQTLLVRPMSAPDQHDEFPLVSIDTINIGNSTLVHILAQPGWRWSTSVGPVVGAPSCPAPHTGYIISGRLGIRMDDGPEAELTAGDVFTCGGGHDGWVIGDEPLSFLEVVPLQD